MTDNGNIVDRAAFKRMGGNDGCTVAGCIRRPVISIGITASELTGEGRGSTKMLARKTHKYCASHGEAVYARLIKSANA